MCVCVYAETCKTYAADVAYIYTESGSERARNDRDGVGRREARNYAMFQSESLLLSLSPFMEFIKSAATTESQRRAAANDFAKSIRACALCAIDH